MELILIKRTCQQFERQRVECYNVSRLKVKVLFCTVNMHVKIYGQIIRALKLHMFQ